VSIGRPPPNRCRQRRLTLGGQALPRPDNDLAVTTLCEVAIGDFEIRDANISFVDLKNVDHPPANLLGIGELVSNSAIIDVGGLSMYLRHH
jgi:hypothetical protein